MNSYDIFRKLTKGIRFNQKRFKGDLERLGVVSKTEEKPKDEDWEDTNEVILNTSPKLNSQLPLESERDETDEKKEDENGRIKILSDVHFDASLNTSKKKKKKKKKNSGEESEEQYEKLKLMQRQIEEINHIRKKNGIHIWGTDVPEPILSFDKLTQDFKVSEVIIRNLVGQGYVDPMPIQMQAWPLLLQGREVLGSAPTGSGKTAAFLVPILHQLEGPRKKGFRAILLAPTRELARQTHRECIRLAEGLGFKAHIISNVARAKQRFGPKSSKKHDILVTTPNRLVHLLQDGDKPILDLSNVEWLVIDESDRLFEGGTRGFRDQLAIIYKACSNPNVKRALFSATFAYEVQQWCKLNLNNVAMVSVGIRNTASEDVTQELVFCGQEHGKLLALRDIFRKGYKPPVLVFVQTKERAKELFRELIYDNIMVDAIHADRTQTQRDNVVRAFRERKIWVLICTELMARGIDFKGVNLVINYDFPQSVVSYIHRVGRTGRAQHKGKAVTFWTMEDKPKLQSIAQVIHDSRQEVPDWMLKLKKPRKNEKKKLFKSDPKRGHVSAYDVYREQSRLQELIKKKKLQKLEKKAARVATNSEAKANDEEMEGSEEQITAEDGTSAYTEDWEDHASQEVKKTTKRGKNKKRKLANGKTKVGKKRIRN